MCEQTVILIRFLSWQKIFFTYVAIPLDAEDLLQTRRIYCKRRELIANVDYLEWKN